MKKKKIKSNISKEIFYALFPIGSLLLDIGTKLPYGRWKKWECKKYGNYIVRYK